MLKSFIILAGKNDPKSCNIWTWSEDWSQRNTDTAQVLFVSTISPLSWLSVFILHSVLLSDVYSLPSEVCTVVSDADCITPVETVCNTVAPTPECQLILRQFFNDTGVFCINVSLTNDVSLAVASARVSVTVGESVNCLGAILIRVHHLGQLCLYSWMEWHGYIILISLIYHISEI